MNNGSNFVNLFKTEKDLSQNFINNTFKNDNEDVILSNEEKKEYQSCFYKPLVSSCDYFTSYDILKRKIILDQNDSSQFVYFDDYQFNDVFNILTFPKIMKNF